MSSSCYLQRRPNYLVNSLLANHFAYGVCRLQFQVHAQRAAAFGTWEQQLPLPAKQPLAPSLERLGHPCSANANSASGVAPVARQQTQQLLVARPQGAPLDEAGSQLLQLQNQSTTNPPDGLGLPMQVQEFDHQPTPDSNPYTSYATGLAARRNSNIHATSSGNTAPTSNTSKRRKGPNSSSTTTTRTKDNTSAHNPDPDPAALTSWIKSSRSLRRMLRLVRQHGPRMNHIHVAAALTHLSQLSDSTPHVASLLAQAASIHPPAHQQQAPHHNALSDTASSPSAPTPLPTPTPPLQSAPPASEQAQATAADTAGDALALCQTLVSLAEQHLSAFDARQLANLAWALGKWPTGLPGRDELLRRVVQTSTPLLHRFSAQELANMLHGCASCCGSVGLPPSDWIEGHARACGELLRRQLDEGQLREAGEGLQEAGHGSGGVGDSKRRFKLPELASLLWAWGVMMTEGGEGPAGGRGPAAGGGLGAVGRQLSGVVGQVLRAQMQLGLARGAAGPQELANSVQGLAHMQVRVPKAAPSVFLTGTCALVGDEWPTVRSASRSCIYHM